jgi:peptidoglycan/LPS O-acetylase OafA/YrhL
MTHLLPRTPLGWWAVRLLILFAALFLPSVALAVSDRWLPWSPRVGFMGLLVGVLAGVTAAVAVARRGERAVLVFLALIVLVFCAILLVGELVDHL